MRKIELVAEDIIGGLQMKNIFRIFSKDIKSITTNWVALVIIVGLMILPSLYAWFNIRASWDPYGNTGGIKVAIVNKDRGGSLKDKTFKCRG